MKFLKQPRAVGPDGLSSFVFMEAGEVVSLLSQKDLDSIWVEGKFIQIVVNRWLHQFTRKVIYDVM